MDKIEKIDGSVIQHGPHNDRIYLMKLNPDNTLGLVAALDNLAMVHGYGKIFAKIPSPEWKAFKSAGYVKEAMVPHLFAGDTDGLFISKYFSKWRQQTQDSENPSNYSEHPVKRPPSNGIPGVITRESVIVQCDPSDAAEMGKIYQEVFETYPFPIQKPEYLSHTMKEDVLYFCIRIEGKIAALAASEIDMKNKNAEMTDFATLPKWRGMGFANVLLNHMEEKIRDRDIKTAYTIARAASTGMNLVFRNMGYHYAGLLVNNSQICGNIQSMTVWYKHL